MFLFQANRNMHYSDSYQLLKKVSSKTSQDLLESELKQLEERVSKESFVMYLQNNKALNKSILELRLEYDVQQLELVQEGLVPILALIEQTKKSASDADIAHYQTLLNLLKDIKTTARQRIHQLQHQSPDSDFNQLARKYATHYLPFDQSSDPFKGSDFRGYCWGHTHRYGELASKGLLHNLSVASDQTLFERFKTNWTFSDILFHRVGWYFSLSYEAKLREAIWNAFLQLDEHTIFNFNFLVDTAGFHSTSVRMVGEGIEYYDNNYGLVKFSNRENAVNFIAAHLLHQAENAHGNISFVTVYKLPYTNRVQHDVFSELPQTGLVQTDQNGENAVHSEALQTAIQDLQEYSQKLRQARGIKAKIKAHELDGLIEELRCLPTSEVGKRIEAILANPNHSIMVNRGTGFYFFGSGFKSHSTTETLLRKIQEQSQGNDELTRSPNL
jgi:hypothetical protein